MKLFLPRRGRTMDLCPFALKYATISSGKEQYELLILAFFSGMLVIYNSMGGFLRIPACNAEILDT